MYVVYGAALAVHHGRENGHKSSTAKILTPRIWIPAAEEFHVGLDLWDVTMCSAWSLRLSRRSRGNLTPGRVGF